MAEKELKKRKEYHAPKGTLTIKMALERLKASDIKTSLSTFRTVAERNRLVTKKIGSQGRFLLDEKKFAKWMSELDLTIPAGYLSIQEAMKKTGFSHSYIFTLIKNHSIPMVYRGLGRGTIYFDFPLLKDIMANK